MDSFVNFMWFWGVRLAVGAVAYFVMYVASYALSVLVFG